MNTNMRGTEMEQKQFDLFEQGIQWVKDERDHPEQRSGWQHVQSTWGWGKVMSKFGIKAKNSHQSWVPVCSSACCLAGNIVLTNGDKFVVQEGFQGDVNVDYCLTPEGEVENIAERAKDLAGLTDYEASTLFEGSNSADFLIEYAATVAERNGYELNLL
jgi:hypothetical protein